MVRDIKVARLYPKNRPCNMKFLLRRHIPFGRGMPPKKKCLPVNIKTLSRKRKSH